MRSVFALLGFLNINEKEIPRNLRFFNISDRFIRLRDGCICGDFSDFATE